MNNLYKVSCDAVANERNGNFESVYWMLGGNLKIVSPLKFLRGDVVEIKSIDENVVHVVPNFLDEEAECDRVLVFLSPTVPLSEDSDYEFSCSESCQILAYQPVLQNGNKSYILLVSAYIGSNNIVIGTEKVNKDKFEFRIFSKHLKEILETPNENS